MSRRVAAAKGDRERTEEATTTTTTSKELANGASDKRDAREDAPTSAASNMRSIALALLVVQNASVSILTRLSRTPSSPGASVYIPAVAVFTAELLKLGVSMTMLVRERRRITITKGHHQPDGIVKTVKKVVWDLAVNQRGEMLRLAVPAALYATQNTLLYTALSNLDAATYQTTYQLKLLTTALFSLAFFKRSLSKRKWFALFLLTAGVAIVQLESTSPSSPPKAVLNAQQDPRIGLAAIFAACVSSGLAGAWFEWILKSPGATVPESPSPSKSKASKSTDSPAVQPPMRIRANSPSLWARNIQLSVPSLIFSLSGVMMSPQLQSHAHPYSSWTSYTIPIPIPRLQDAWMGFTPLVWAVVVNQALGGLLVAMVVRYADSVAKGFATSLAIVLSSLASVIIFHTLPGPLFVAGAGLVILSTCLYAADKD